MIFVDEKHLRQRIGGGGALDLVWVFPEDKEGNLDVENGKEGECPCELKMKYEKEGRYAFACVAKAADGESKCEVIFTYTGELSWMGSLSMKLLLVQLCDLCPFHFLSFWGPPRVVCCSGIFFLTAFLGTTRVGFPLLYITVHASP